jgi:hypothetical protein
MTNGRETWRLGVGCGVLPPAAASSELSSDRASRARALTPMSIKQNTTVLSGRAHRSKTNRESMTISKPSNIKTPNATGRVAQSTKETEVNTISLEHSTQTLKVIESPVKGYIIGIIELRDLIPTGEPGQYEDWKQVHSAGGFGMYNMLLALFGEVSEHIGEVWGSDDVKQQAITELLEDVRQDLADERHKLDHENVATQQTA